MTRRAGRLARSIRGLSIAGVPPDVIARRLDVSLEDVREILDRPVSPSPAPRLGRSRGRAIKGPLCIIVRRHHRAGLDPAAVAELLNLDPAAVAGYIARAFPPPRPPRPVRGPVRRPWSHLQGPEWCDDDDDQVVAEGLAASPPVAPPPAGTPASLPTSPATSSPCGEWGPIVGGQLGARSNAAALTDADAELVRELRARGVSRTAVARRFGVSVATITRITRGETYRPVPAEPDPPPPPPVEPEIPAAEPPATSWSQPAGWISADRSAEWRDD